MTTRKIIGLLVGSFRASGNTKGIASWVEYCIKQSCPDSEVKIYTPVKPINILPECINPVAPLAVISPDDYVNPVIRRWAHAVSECDAYVIITPEYNHSYSGYLKIMFDHLFNEFGGKPGTLITFASSGGENAYKQLKNLATKFGISPIDGMHFSIPRSYITGRDRIAETFSPEKLMEDPFLKDLNDRLKERLSHL
ncbi:hypothetical protein FOA43_001461 [Brettanomyces nanus]|uniref:NADPH-dependent FMN reductase-like domain-containing protein n=1 Tax=Eeniella nana TaxID=13502 RepID=A0A875S2U0_EENNA|nr:uncharacterized protein FOA43_001461 [Brettanomyces nanus]QPG74139.1 hypothetical protein FOA43_001461 [Brettanomyces nanus]